MDTLLLPLLFPRNAVAAQLRSIEVTIAHYSLNVPLDVEAERNRLILELDLLDTELANRQTSNVGTSVTSSPMLTSEQRLTFKPLIDREFARFQQSLKILTTELPAMPVLVVTIARSQIEEAHAMIVDLLAEWTTMQPLTQTDDERVHRLVRRLDQIEKTLHLHILRQVHARNLRAIEQQLAFQQDMPLLDKPHNHLQNAIRLERQEIEQITARPGVDESKQRLLAIRHQNLQWFQEMLIGERPTVPIHLLHAQQRSESNIQAIDAQLTQTSH